MKKMIKCQKALDAYWEERLNINYKAEDEYYKKLCGYKYRARLVNKMCNNKNSLISYNSWKEKIRKQVQYLNLQCLIEYSRYLEQKRRMYENDFMLTQTLLIPFAFFIVGMFMDNLVEPILKEAYKKYKTYIILCLWYVLVITTYIFTNLMNIKKDSPYKFFYQDMKEIVDERIEEQRKEKRERE